MAVDSTRRIIFHLMIFLGVFWLLMMLLLQLSRFVHVFLFAYRIHTQHTYNIYTRTYIYIYYINARSGDSGKGAVALMKRPTTMEWYGITQILQQHFHTLLARLYCTVDLLESHISEVATSACPIHYRRKNSSANLFSSHPYSIYIILYECLRVMQISISFSGENPSTMLNKITQHEYHKNCSSCLYTMLMLWSSWWVFLNQVIWRSL